MPFMQGPGGGGGSQEQTLCQVAGASKAQMGSQNAGWLGVGGGGGQLVQAHFPIVHCTAQAQEGWTSSLQKTFQGFVYAF